jgi:hypothetical protein
MSDFDCTLLASITAADNALALNQLQTNANTTFSHVNKLSHFTMRKRPPQRFRATAVAADVPPPQHNNLINYQRVQPSPAQHDHENIQLALRTSFNNVYRLKNNNFNFLDP